MVLRSGLYFLEVEINLSPASGCNNITELKWECTGNQLITIAMLALVEQRKLNSVYPVQTVFLVLHSGKVSLQYFICIKLSFHIFLINIFVFVFVFHTSLLNISIQVNILGSYLCQYSLYIQYFLPSIYCCSLCLNFLSNIS